MNIDRLYVSLAVVCLALSFVFLILGAFGSLAGMPDSGLAGGMCFIAFFVPGIFFANYWRRRVILARRLSELADVLKGYRQITMTELAAKIGTTPESAELLVAACIGRGLVQGRIDTKERVFIIVADHDMKDKEDTSC